MTTRDLTVGELPRKTAAPATHNQTFDIVGWALPLYLLLLCGGFAFLRSPMATVRGGELSIDRAAFTSINVVTGTGFSQSIALDGLTPLGREAIVALIGCGAVLTLSVGGSLVNTGAGLDYSEKPIVAAAVILVAASAAIGAITLSDSAKHGLMQGVGAVSNCGLVVVGPLGGLDRISTWLVLLPLSVVGGLGVPVVLDVGRRLFLRKTISSHSMMVLVSSAFVYVIGTVVLSFATTLSNASAIAIDSRSAGFDLVPWSAVARGGWWVVMVLMAIGAGPGGSGGGLKVTLPIVLWRGGVRSYQREVSQRGFAIALAWLIGFGVVVFAGTVTLVALQPQVPADRVLFVVISAMSNTGLSGDPITMVGAPLLVLGGLALLGRAMPFLVLWWWSNRVQSGERGDGVAVG